LLAKGHLTIDSDDRKEEKPEKTHAEHHWWDWYAPYLSAVRTAAVRRRQQPQPTATWWTRPLMLFRDDAVAALSWYADR